MKDLFKELFSKPREWHSYSIAVILMSLGLFYQPLGGALSIFALGIGLIVLGVRAKTVREYLNTEILPEKVNIPDDVAKEPFYYWAGILTPFVVQSFFGFIASLV